MTDGHFQLHFQCYHRSIGVLEIYLLGLTRKFSTFHFAMHM